MEPSDLNGIIKYDPNCGSYFKENETVNLRNAIASGNVKDFSYLMKRYNISPNVVLRNGHSLVCFIIDYCNSGNWRKLIELLLKQGVDVNTRDKDTVTLLSKLVISGEVRLLEMALDRGANIELTGWHEDTPLFTAIHYKQIDCLRLLLERGANVNTVDSDGNSPLMWAAGRSNGIGMQRSFSCVKLLLRYAAKVNFINNRGYTPLMAASLIQETDVVHCLLKYGAKTQMVDNKGENALHKAAYGGAVDIVQILLTFGAKVNSKDCDGYTALLHTTSLPIAKMLLKAGARVNEINNDGNCIIHLCAERDDTYLIKLLLDFGVLCDQRNFKGDTPLLIALRSRSFAVVEHLLALGVNICAINCQKVGSLHETMAPSKFFGSMDLFNVLSSPDLLMEFQRYSLQHSKWSLSISKDLIDKGIDVNARNNDGTTALMLAALSGNSDLVLFLIKNGACPFTLDDDSRGLLSYAAKSGEPKIVRIFLSLGCPPSVQDKFGNLPIFYAAFFQHMDICDLLIIDFAYFYAYNCIHF